MPLSGMNAPGIAVAGAPPFPLAAAAAPPQPLNVNSSLSVVSENPTPPLDSAAGKAAAASAAATDLRNEDQLHRLQCRLHSEGSPSITAEGLPYGASPPLGDASGAPAVAAVAGATSALPMNRAASSGPMDDDTLDILWGMVMDEGNTSGKAGAGRLKSGDMANLETAADLADLFENDEKLGDMLEDAEGMLLADLGSSGGGSDDFDAALADDAIAATLAEDRRKGAAEDDDLYPSSDSASNIARTKPTKADEEQEMAAIAASAVSAFEQELRDARLTAAAGSASVASANATPGKMAPT